VSSLLAFAVGAVVVGLVTTAVGMLGALREAWNRQRECCQRCGATLDRAPIHDTSRGCILYCPRCGARHAYEADP